MSQRQVRRLLIVDDDRVQRMVFRSVALAAGFEIHEASSVDEARDVSRRISIDTAIVDLSLGASDGIEVVRELSECERKPAILIVSGHNDRIRDAAQRFCRAVRVETLGELRKPVDIGKLRALLHAKILETERTQPLDDIPLDAERISSAIESRAIGVVYQPKVCLQTNSVIGAEALARWAVHGSAISPSRFCRLAEEFGLGLELTLSILRAACLDAAIWNQSRKVSVAVNVPPIVLCDAAFPAAVARILDETGLEAGRLILEVVETGPALEQSMIAGVLTRLRLRGVRLAIDDFGTGFSSLDSLLNLPFTEMKLDARFVRDCDRDPYALKIVKASLGLAKEFGIKCVAEGIERDDVRRLLQSLDCDYGQGWLFSAAVDAVRLGQLIVSKGRFSSGDGRDAA